MSESKKGDRHPVVLVHGIFDTMAKFKTMTRFLTEKGWSVHSLNLVPNDGSASLTQLAKQVADYIDRTFPPQQAIDLVGFSMGGVVTRYYLQRLAGVERVKRYITISAPNQGTLLGYGLPLAGVREMRWQSELLQDLNQDYQALLSALQVTVLWTPFDLMILPPSSSQLEIGEEIVLPVPVHAWMVSDRRCLEAVEKALSKPLAG
ncbi:MAG: triacylglycerol lipase [Synechocystis sp.]|nr:triacylglycerol lipase [Synechocystis sp.]